MAKKLRNLARGAGSILEIAPNSGREISRPLYVRPRSDSEGIRSYWFAVGSYFREALEAAKHGEAEKKSA